MSKQSLDIFCQVIDNYGDIGVCWRLARQLANEYSFNVRLWVDEIAALIQLNPAAKNTDRQQLDDVEVCVWHKEFKPTTSADIIIEAFGCELPEEYLKDIRERAQQAAAPVWINLEYLSGESWVEDCHLKQSYHQPTGLFKTFFFPGFSESTGGIVRESTLLAERDSFTANPDAQTVLLNRLSLTQKPEGILVSLFSYENPAIASLLDTWANSPIPVTCLVPEGKSLHSLNQALAEQMATGQSKTLGNLTLLVIPFLSQQDYDRLLWLCDVNFVRGEDSFVRAQLAGKPMIWQIYPQQEMAHTPKLDAFLQLYTKNLAGTLKNAIVSLWNAWNQQENMQQPWQFIQQYHLEWCEFCLDWQRQLVERPDLASNLADFVAKKQFKKD